jgi:hypothetical protein
MRLRVQGKRLAVVSRRNVSFSNRKQRKKACGGLIITA